MYYITNNNSSSIYEVMSCYYLANLLMRIVLFIQGDIMNNPFNSGYYEKHELDDFGFKSIGSSVRIAKNCTIIGLENISIGNNVQIDSYCSIIANGEGWLNIGSYVHIAGYCLLSAGAGIEINDFGGLSQGVRIYSKTDDFSGNHLTNPTVPDDFTKVTCGMIKLGRHVIIGSGGVILPNVTIEEGSSVGALSLVTKDLEPWGVYTGIPVKRLKERSKKILKLESQLLKKFSK